MTTNRGQAQYLRIFDDSSTYTRWQNYYVGQSVTLDANSWSYFPFTVNGLTAGAGSGNNVTVSIPATGDAVSVFTAALSENRLCEINVYEFDSRLGQSAPSAQQVQIVGFTGEILKISGSFTLWTITVGSSLAPVGAQVPPRKFTNELVGFPIKL